MKLTTGRVIAVWILMPPFITFGQDAASDPVKTTLCELRDLPVRFNGKMVQVRAKAWARVGLSEGLRDDSCSAFFEFDGDGFPALSGHTGEFAFIASPAVLQQPEKLRWHPIRLPAPVEFVKNEAFYEYKEYVFQLLKNTDGSTCFTCPAFDITMTVTGRFDYVEQALIAVRANRQSKPEWFLSGFGRVHGSSSRLSWRLISDVVVRPIDPSVYHDRK